MGSTTAGTVASYVLYTVYLCTTIYYLLLNCYDLLNRCTGKRTAPVGDRAHGVAEDVAERVDGPAGIGAFAIWLRRLLLRLHDRVLISFVHGLP